MDAHAARPVSRIAAAIMLTLAACTPTDRDREAQLWTPDSVLEAPAERDPDQPLDAETMARFQRTAAELAQYPDGPDDPRRAEFAEVVLPSLVTGYPLEANAGLRDAMLDVALQLAQPEAVGLWVEAIAVDSTRGIDGSSDGHRRALMALRGIQAAAARFPSDPVWEPLAVELGASLTALRGKTAYDSVREHEGELRQALIVTLGVLEAKAGVEPLIATLETRDLDQPRAVTRAAIEALGQIGDPAAVEALIVVQFAVPDTPSTNSIPERAIRALGAIGEPAVPALVDVLEGSNARVNELASQHGIDQQIVQHSAIRMLGVIGSATAVAPILVSMPTQDCAAKGDLDVEASLGRAFAANALGFIGDGAAVDPLCRCRNASHDPTDLWEIATALGRIGGDEAFACLKDIVAHGSYDPESVDPQHEYEIRWEAARFLVLVASPTQTAEIQRVIAGNKPKVAAEFEREGYPAGVAVVDRCKRDSVCYENVLLDATRTWFEREVAAFHFARLSTPGDLVAAAKLAQAFKTRDPEARVHIAWLTAKIADGQPCPECVAALETVMKAEDKTKDATMQAAWIMARQTIAKLGHRRPR